MPAGQVIVLERDGHWATALRRELGAAVRVIETRSWDELWQRLAEGPAALTAVELTEANIDRVIDGLVRLDRQFPHAAMLVLAERRFSPYRGLICEAGALHFVTSPRKLVEVAAIVQRRLVASHGAIGAAGGFDEILADLPWSEAVE